MPTFENTAALTATLGATTFDDESTVEITLEDVWFDKRALPSQTWQGGPLTYEIQVRNDSVDEDLTGIQIVDAIDLNYTTYEADSAAVNPATAGTVTYNTETNSIEATIALLEPGESATITFRVNRVL